MKANETALIVVDMQNDFVSEDGSLHVPDAFKTLKPIIQLLDAADVSGMQVFFTKDTHYKGDPEFDIWPEHCVKDTWGWDIYPQLGSDCKEYIILEKMRYDAFYDTSIDHILRTKEIKNLIIVGTVANICVHYTAASAALRWYNVIVPRDCVSALDQEDVDATFRQITNLFNGTVCDREDIKISV